MNGVRQFVALVCEVCGGISDGPIEAPGVCTCKDADPVRFDPTPVVPLAALQEEQEKSARETKRLISVAVRGERERRGAPAGLIGLQRGREESHRRIAELEDQHDSLVSKIKDEVGRMRREVGDPDLNEFAAQQAEVDADRLQAILSDVEGGT